MTPEELRPLLVEIPSSASTPSPRRVPGAEPGGRLAGAPRGGDGRGDATAWRLALTGDASPRRVDALLAVLTGDGTRGPAVDGDARATPWLGWLLLAAVRYRERQRWAARHVGEHVLGRRRCDQSAPGLPGWWLTSDHERALLVSSETGEQIAVGYDHGRAGPGALGPDAIAPGDLATWIASRVLPLGAHLRPANDGAPSRPAGGPIARAIRVVAAPSTPEHRVWHWLPSWTLIAAAVAALDRLGLGRRDGDLVGFAEPLERVAARTSRLDLDDAAAVAGWAERLGDPGLDPRASTRRVVAARSAHLDLAQRLLRLDSPLLSRAAALPLLAALHRGPELVWACDAILDAEPASARAVIAFLAGQPHLPSSSGLARFLAAQEPTGNLVAILTACDYLLERQGHVELAVARFRAVVRYQEPRGWPSGLDRATKLALDFVPYEAMPLLRQALRRPERSIVLDSAAALLALDLRWCARELAAALRDRPPGAVLLAEALGLCAHRPVDIPAFVGVSRVRERADWYQRHNARDYPDDFDGTPPA